MPMRYMVRNVEVSIRFYVDRLGFELVEQWGPAFAVVSCDDLELWLSGPGTSAAQPMPDGLVPEPGGWNRIVVLVDDFDSLHKSLASSGITFRNEPISGPGGRQVLLEDPDGNPIEIFERQS